MEDGSKLTKNKNEFSNIYTSYRFYSYRFYRDFISGSRFIKFNIIYYESDLLILLPSNIEESRLNLIKIEIKKELLKTYQTIRKYCLDNMDFLYSLKPVNILNGDPEIIKIMKKVSFATNVGPMAGVAGAVAYFIIKKILNLGVEEAIVENGGDIALFVKSPINILLFSGSRYFKSSIGIKFNKLNKIYGISTSSGKFGHSKSFGNADSVTVISQSPVFSDSFATAIGNKIKNEKDLYKVDKLKYNKEYIDAIIAVYKDKLFKKGDVELIFSNSGNGI